MYMWETEWALPPYNHYNTENMSSIVLSGYEPGMCLREWNSVVRRKILLREDEWYTSAKVSQASLADIVSDNDCCSFFPQLKYISENTQRSHLSQRALASRGTSESIIGRTFRRMKRILMAFFQLP